MEIEPDKDLAAKARHLSQYLLRDFNLFTSVNPLE
jgi:hypothetical protein